MCLIYRNIYPSCYADWFEFSCTVNPDECRPKSEPATIHGSIQVWVNHSHLNLKVFHTFSVPTTDGETERARRLVCFVHSCAMTRRGVNQRTLTVYFLVLYMLIFKWLSLIKFLSWHFFPEIFWLLYTSHFFITVWDDLQVYLQQNTQKKQHYWMKGFFLHLGEVGF